MAEFLSQEEIDRLLAAINGAGNRTLADGEGRPVVIDYKTFCSYISAYGFNQIALAQIKAALLEAELAYRFSGRKKELNKEP
jgi:hypothetical protein